MVNEIKVKNAVHLVRFLQEAGVSFAGKRVLDVGTGAGENAAEMKQAGADVYGVDPDEERLNHAVEHGYLTEEKIFRGKKIQDIADEVAGQFDLVTCFLYCVDFVERKPFAQGIGKALKPDGIGIVGIYDGAFILDQHQDSIRNILSHHFRSKVSMRDHYGLNRLLEFCAEYNESGKRVRDYRMHPVIEAVRQKKAERNAFDYWYDESFTDLRFEQDL